MKATWILAATLALVSVTASPAGAAEPEASDADARGLALTTMSCRTLLQAGGDERDLLLALFHGYVAGKAGSTTLDTVRMSFLTDLVIDHCIDKPRDPVLAAFAAAEPPAQKP